MIRVRDAVWVRGGRRAVDGVTLEIAPRAFTAIVGPNGAGKSSLMMLMAGLASPTDGTVDWDGESLAGIGHRELARRRAWVEQQAVLEAEFTVEEVVELGGVAVGAAPESVVRALRRVDLLDRRTQRYPTLSGGERQRVQLARALVQLGAFEEPVRDLDLRVLFLDEPTASLDPGATVSLLRLVRGLVSERGLTAVTVLHDLNEAAAVADEMVILAHGAVVDRGPVAEVFDPRRFSEIYGCEFQEVAREGALPLLVPALSADGRSPAVADGTDAAPGSPSPDQP